MGILTLNQLIQLVPDIYLFTVSRVPCQKHLAFGYFSTKKIWKFEIKFYVCIQIFFTKGNIWKFKFLTNISQIFGKKFSSLRIPIPLPQAGYRDNNTSRLDTLQQKKFWKFIIKIYVCIQNFFTKSVSLKILNYLKTRS